MKRKSFIIFCLCLLVTSGFGKQKITRVIQELDYKDYGKGIFQQITNDIYTLTISGKIKAFNDSTLKSEYNIEDLKKRGSTSETVQFQNGDHTGGDTTVYLAFDYENVPMWLEIKGDIRSSNAGMDLPLALCYEDKNIKQILFYINYQDVKKLTLRESNFLQQCFNSVYNENPTLCWEVINFESIQKYVVKQFSYALKTLKSATYSRLKVYTSDSMNTLYDSASLNGKKRHFSEYGQNLDTEATMGIILIQEFNDNEDSTATITIKIIGLCADIKMKGIQLYNVPLCYMKYWDLMLIEMYNSNADYAQSIPLLRHVSDYQLLNRSSDNPLNSN